MEQVLDMWEILKRRLIQQEVMRLKNLMVRNIKEAISPFTGNSFDDPLGMGSPAIQVAEKGLYAAIELDLETLATTNILQRFSKVFETLMKE